MSSLYWTRRRMLAASVAASAVALANHRALSDRLGAVGEHRSFADLDEYLASFTIDPNVLRACARSWPDFPAYFPRWRHVPSVGLVERSYSIPGGGWQGPFPLPAGMDGSAITATIAANGARRRINCAELKPRINSYGDSFTHCDQVNDGETWQEQLAAHLGEPIGNFGRGGGSVYEAYLRMKREELTDHGARYILFYLWGDDHLRSLGGRTLGLLGFGGKYNPIPMSLPYIYFDVEAGSFAEGAGLVSSPEQLDLLNDKQWLARECHNDLALQLILFAGYGPTKHLAGTIRSVNRQAVDRLGKAFDMHLDWNDSARLRDQIYHLLDIYSLEGSKFVLDQVHRFAQDHNKKVMIILFDPYRSVPELIATGKRYDQPIVDYLKHNSYTYFDMTEVQFEDFKNQDRSYDTYRNRYFVDRNGHYNSEGNNLFAFSLKDHLVNWLSPEPLSYRRAGKPNDDNYIFNGRLGNSVDGH